MSTLQQPTLGPMIHEGAMHVPLPYSAFVPQGSSTISPIVCEKAAVPHLLQMIMRRGGMTTGEIARRLGLRDENVRQYLKGRRQCPSLLWFVRFAELCGSRVTIEFPQRR